MNDLTTMNLNGHGQSRGMMTGLGSTLGTFPYHQPTNFHNPGLPTIGANGYGVGFIHNDEPAKLSIQRPLHGHESTKQDPYMQPHMMCNRSPLVSPYTGYYQVNPYPSSRSENSDSAAHMHSDETTSSCLGM